MTFPKVSPTLEKGKYGLYSCFHEAVHDLGTKIVFVCVVFLFFCRL